jgi:flagellar hook-length control protein FliK
LSEADNSSSVTVLMMLPSEPSVTGAPVEETSAQAIISTIAASASGLPVKQSPAGTIPGSGYIDGHAGASQAVALNSIPEVAGQSRAFNQGNNIGPQALQDQKSIPAEAGAIRVSPEQKQTGETPASGKFTLPDMATRGDARTSEIPIAVKPQSNQQALHASDQASTSETVSQPSSTQNTPLQGMASQLNAAFQVAGSQSIAIDAAQTSQIAPRVGASGWSEAMGQKIVMMASEHVQQAELRLNPEGLGPMHVVLSLEKGAADVQFVAHDAQVREALQTALPKLQEMLTSAGFSLDRVSIGSGSASNQGNQGNAGQFQQQQREAGGKEAETASMPLSRVVVQSRPGRIDTFA